MHRTPLLFPLELCNCHETTLHNEPRTNNLCESWNRSFQSVVELPHHILETGHQLEKRQSASWDIYLAGLQRTASKEAYTITSLDQKLPTLLQTLKTLCTRVARCLAFDQTVRHLSWSSSTWQQLKPDMF